MNPYILENMQFMENVLEPGLIFLHVKYVFTQIVFYSVEHPFGNYIPASY